MIKQIVKIRRKQAYRNIASIGIFRIAVVFILAVFLFAFIFNQLHETINGIIVILLFTVFVLFLHLQRTDKVFISIIYNSPRLIYFAEYLILSLPILITSFLAKRYDLMIYALVGISVIPFFNISIKIKKENLNNKILNLIPNRCFEIKSGFRQYFYFIIPLNILALILGFWIGSAPIMLIINTLIFTSFYQTCEPRNIIEINELSPDSFISKKLKNNLLVFTLLHTPVISMFLLFNYQYFIIIAIVWVCGVLFLVFAILLKYALYSPNADLKANSIIISIAVFFPPIIFFMLPIYYFKAKNNLIFYLDDYN